MPLHDLRCTVCDTRFEWLARASEDPACPGCSAPAVERLLSTFAVGGAAPTARRTPAASVPSG
ncbi:MAG: FmdB family zinc ribbon protein [Planctomycetota bacterium]|jgi:putative FmdB family regulatory protein